MIRSSSALRLLPLVALVASYAACTGFTWSGGAPDSPVVDGATTPVLDAASSFDAAPDTAPLEGDAALPDAAPVDASVDADAAPLDAGITPLLVFVTAATYSGAFATGIPLSTDPRTTADAHCAASAEVLGVDGPWFAYLSKGTEPAAERLPKSGAWYLPDPSRPGGVGALVFASRAMIFTGPATPINVTAGGNPPDPASGQLVWTGTSSTGNLGATCNDWRPTSGSSGTAGDLSSVATWASASSTPCTASAHLYCFQVP